MVFILRIAQDEAVAEPNGAESYTGIPSRRETHVMQFLVAHVAGKDDLVRKTTTVAAKARRSRVCYSAKLASSR